MGNTWIPLIKDIKGIDDLEVNSVYQVRFGDRMPRPMVYEGSVDNKRTIIGFMEISPDMNKILSWRTNKNSLEIEVGSDLGTVVFTDERKMEEYNIDSQEFQVKYPLLMDANMRFTL